MKKWNLKNGFLVTQGGDTQLSRFTLNLYHGDVFLASILPGQMMYKYRHQFSCPPSFSKTSKAIKIQIMNTWASDALENLVVNRQNKVKEARSNLDKQFYLFKQITNIKEKYHG